MKLIPAFVGLTLLLCSFAPAQDSPDRIVVPARNTSRPRVVNATSTHGSITVKVHSGKDVIVESPRAASRLSRGDQTVDGLHRIDLPMRGLSVEEEDNVITVHTSAMAPGNVVISVPADTSLHLKTTHGDVEADGVRGEVEATTTHGHVHLTNISGNVVASSTNGSVTVTMNQVDQSKPMSFSSVNGSLDITFPAATKANLKLKSVRGSVWSDFEMKLNGSQPVSTPGGADVKFKVDFDRTMYGTINGGGVEASFYTVNGRILIRKK